MRQHITVVIFFSFVIPVAGQQAVSEPPIIIKAARLIDGRGGAPNVPAMVRIEGERIAEVASQLPIPANARVIDLGDATLLPGLIDLHNEVVEMKRQRIWCLPR